MKKLALIPIILTACAPLSESIPKDKLCNGMSNYNSVHVSDRSYDVETKMGKQPDSESVNGTSMTQVYSMCKEFEFSYLNDEVISKRVK